MAAASDLNLVFGMIALQCDFITKEQLFAGMQAWIFDKSKSLGDILVEQKALDAEERRLLDPLIQKHLAKHDNDPVRSLAAISSRSSADDLLRQLPDADLQASLAQVQAAHSEPKPVDLSTIDPPVEDVRFRILRPHAKGGLGIVYVAHDREVNRQVALKEIQSHRAGDENSRARFLLEAEITGGLEHPGIVPIYGLGHYADGRPFYAMRFIKGDSLQTAVDAFHKADVPGRDATERDVSLKQLLRRFIDVCNAIDYAHSKGVLHRDLKPGNVMLGKFGETLVVDWGLAKATGTVGGGSTPSMAETPLKPASGGSGDPTMMGCAIGTPQYMPPEQAAGRLDLLGPASDVYSLGATLYHLLTGRPPCVAESVEQVLRDVQDGKISRPREIKPAIDPALEAICLKALAKEPSARYPSSAALRKDIENWIADAPISARPDPTSVKLRRWLVRHRVLAATTAAALVVAAAFLGVLAYITGQANEQLAGLVKKEGDARKKAEAAEKKSSEETRRLAVTTGFAADGAWESGKVQEARVFLRQIPEPLRGWEWRYRQRRFEGSYATLYGHTGRVWSVAFSPDGQRLASASEDNTVKVWDARTGIDILTLRGHNSRVNSVAFSPDGQKLATGSDDETVKLWDARTGIEIVNLHGKQRKTVKLPPGQGIIPKRPVNFVVFSPDGACLACVIGSGFESQTVKVWDMRKGTEIVTLRGQRISANSVAFSPDGQRLAGGDDGAVKVWNVQTGTELCSMRGHTGPVRSVAYSPDGQRLASVSWDQTLRVWDARTGTEIVTRREQIGIDSIAFSPDGQRLTGAAEHESVKLWNTRTWTEIVTLRGHTARISSVAFSPDGQRLASGSWDETVKLWDARTGTEIVTLHGHTDWVSSVAFSKDGQRLASASRDKTAKVRDARTGTEIVTFHGHTELVTSIAFSPDGQKLATASDDKTVKVWDARTGTEIVAFRGHSKEVSSVAFSPDGQRLASGSQDQTVQIWNTLTGANILPLRGHTAAVAAVAFSPDGMRLASGDGDGTVKLWDLRTGAEIVTLRAQNGVHSIAFSPDGQWLACGNLYNTVNVWDTRTWTEIVTLKVHKGADSIAFSPDGQRLACGGHRCSSGPNDLVTVWDARTWTEIIALHGHTATVNSVVFSPDGQRLASADSDVKLWDARMGTKIVRLRGHTDPVLSVTFSPDGRRLASGSEDKTVKVWDTLSGTEIVTLRGQTTGVRSIAFSADGQRIQVLDLGNRKVWNVTTGEEVQEQGTEFVSADLRRNPSRPMIAAVEGSDILLIDVGPPSEDDQAYRAAMSRFEPTWHREQANAAGKSKELYAAVYHHGQLALHESGDDKLWTDFLRAFDQLGDDRFAFQTVDLAIAQSPDVAAVYRARAQFRAKYMQTAEATADQIMALVLTVRASQKPAGTAK